ncbi:MAG: alpha/beta hydrolase [Acidobacteriota bacterium]|nr:alpha/beta hydrolase [Acidobacteriota bacterium]
MPVINVNDVALNYHEQGNRDRRTIVFAHALLWSSEVFDYLVSELEDDFHIIVVDIHGHGKSGYRTPMTLEEITDDYYHLLTKLDLSKVIWIGFSIGGMIGMRLALQHPEIIDSLILIATTARLDPPQIREQTWKLWEMFRDGHRASIADAALQFFFAPATYKNQPQLVEHYRHQLINFKQVEGMFEAARAVFDRNDIGDEISTIKAPTLVIAGKDDTATSPMESEVIASRIPNAQVKIFDEANHLLVVEKPQEVVRVMRDFLR